MARTRSQNIDTDTCHMCHTNMHTFARQTTPVEEHTRNEHTHTCTQRHAPPTSLAKDNSRCRRELRAATANRAEAEAKAEAKKHMLGAKLWVASKVRRYKERKGERERVRVRTDSLLLLLRLFLLLSCCCCSVLVFGLLCGVLYTHAHTHTHIWQHVHNSVGTSAEDSAAVIGQDNEQQANADEE